MRKNLKYYIIALTLGLSVIGCVLASCAAPPAKVNKRLVDIGSGVQRVHDDGYKVTCWLYAQAIHCIPDAALGIGDNNP